MRCEQRAANVGGGARPARLVGVEPPVVVAEPMLRVLRELGADAVDLRRRSGEIDPSALRVVAVDRLGGDDATDLVDGVVHRPLESDRRVASVAAGNGRQAHREQRRAPSAIAAAGPETHRRPFEHGDPQRGIGRRQVVAGPGPGEAGTDDHDVVLGITGQRLEVASLRVGQRVVPQRRGMRRGIDGGTVHGNTLRLPPLRP